MKFEIWTDDDGEDSAGVYEAKSSKEAVVLWANDWNGAAEKLLVHVRSRHGVVTYGVEFRMTFEFHEEPVGSS